MSRFQRPNIARMQGYTWGEQPTDRNAIKLNTNENPFPPSPEVARALEQISTTDLRRYPQPTADPLRDLIAEQHGVTRDHVVITHGGDEALRLALTTFVEPGAQFAMAEPSYSLYPVLAEIQDAHITRVPLLDDWSLPEDAVAQLNAAEAQLACLVNPHAPSGHLTDVNTLQAIATAFKGVLLIDEAYADFIDPGLEYNSMALTRELDNVLILRTFSKGYSLAAMRLGYLVGHPDLIDPIVSKTRDSYNIDHISQALGYAAFADQQYARECWATVREERHRVSLALSQLGLSAPPSETNFILVSVQEDLPLSAFEIYQALKERGILVRYFDADRLRDKLRISIGTKEENEALTSALTELLT